MNESQMFDYLEERKEITPDFKLLKEKPFHYVFVYGTLKRGGSNHCLLENSLFISQGMTSKTSYKMYQIGGGFTFPVVFDGIKDSFSGRVAGELYAVTPEVVCDLDALEANGEMYNRKKTNIEVRKKNNGTHFIYANVYLANEEYWRDSKLDEVARIDELYNGFREEKFYKY